MNQFKRIDEATLCDVEGSIRVITSSKADWDSVDLLPVIWKKFPQSVSVNMKTILLEKKDFTRNCLKVAIATAA